MKTRTEQAVKEEPKRTGCRVEVVKSWKHKPTTERLRAAAEGGTERLIRDETGAWLLLSLIRERTNDVVSCQSGKPGG